eukprot:gene17079-18800_t
METSRPQPAFKSPRPVPVITNDKTFSHKRKGIARYSPPKPPAKSAPPISRVFRCTRKSSSGPQAVSFRERNSSIESPHYNAELHVSYFEQCFKVLSRLGCGSFGEVFKVQSKEDGKLYAVKKSRVRFRGDYDRKQKLEEVHKHEKIQDARNCVKFYRAWEESLKDYAEKVQAIDECEVWNMLVDLTLGLKHLHDYGFAHMDIKPANLFLGRDGYYKIGDFGLALEVGKPQEVSEAQEGDPKYMAPELMQGNFTKAADVFSLGITMLELACNMELPKGGALWQNLRDDKLPLEFTEGISKEMLSLIQKMMQKDWRHRPTVEEILAEVKVEKVLRQRNRFWLTSKMQNVGSAIMYYVLLLTSLLLKILWYPTSVFTTEPTTPSIESRVPPSDLDSTFPQSSDSSLSFEGHESLFNYSSSEEHAWPIPSPRKPHMSDSAVLKCHLNMQSFTPDLKIPSVFESSPEHNRSGGSPHSNLSVSSNFSPMFNPRGNPRRSCTPISDKLPRTRLFIDEDGEYEIEPKNLLLTFNDV